MKNHVIATATMLCALLLPAPPFAASVGAQPSSMHPKSLGDSLLQLERKSWDAWKARDSAFYRTFLSDDHVELGFTGRSDKPDVLATVATPHCVVTSYSVEDFKVTQFDANTALLTYHASQTRSAAGSQCRARPGSARCTYGARIDG